MAKEIINQPISEEMKKAYLDYAMSVIVSRALPDTRDGLKPVQRRIIFAMHQQGINHTARFVKCAAVVGETMKKYHPHGDVAIYDALVRMGQDFSLRYPLITGQGNFGSVDGDPPAAMRYTEGRLAKIAETISTDIEKETVSWMPNYTGQIKEPVFLPAVLPNLLLNGASGIAVGMATSIPPHHLGEVIDALIFMIEHPEKGSPNGEKEPPRKFESAVTVEDLTNFIKGPDFPTGGIIYGQKDINQLYATGKGGIVTRAKATIQEDSQGRFAIIVTEIPYQVNKASLVTKIADLVKSKRVDGISDLRDESDRDGMRIAIELKKEANPKRVLNLLYKHSPLQNTFHGNMVALTSGEPKLLTLKMILEDFIRHRQKVVFRRTQFLLKQAQAREHILQGLKIALDHIDEVIETIKKSPDTETARDNLIKKFKLSEIQAQAILDMPLKRLAALERKKIEDELKEILAAIAKYEAILANPGKVLQIVKEELLKIKEQFGDERRTKIVKGRIGEFAEEELIKKEEVAVSITRSGYIKRLPIDTYHRQHRGGKGIKGSKLKEEDIVSDIVVASTHAAILFFTDQGKVYELRVWDVPDASRTAKGTAVVNLIGIGQGERVTAILTIPSDPEGNNSKKPTGAKQYIFMTTKRGIVKRTPLTDFDNIRSSGIIAIRLSGDDRLDWVKLTNGQHEILMVTKMGKAIRFAETDVRSMGRPARGVKGINLGKDDEVVEMDIVPTQSAKPQMIVISANGYGKKTNLTEYPRHKRGGKGVLTARTTAKTGPVVGAKIIPPDSGDILLISSGGQVVRLSLKQITTLKRATQGVILMRFKGQDHLASLAVV